MKFRCSFLRSSPSPLIQQTFYAEHGGQPGHRQAWLSPHANYLTNQYFASTLPTLDESYLRPRYNGYLHFQDEAGLPLQQYLQHGGNERKVLAALNTIYKQSRHPIGASLTHE